MSVERISEYDSCHFMFWNDGSISEKCCKTVKGPQMTLVLISVGKRTKNDHNKL